MSKFSKFCLVIVLLHTSDQEKRYRQEGIIFQMDINTLLIIW